MRQWPSTSGWTVTWCHRRWWRWHASRTHWLTRQRYVLLYSTRILHRYLLKYLHRLQSTCFSFCTLIVYFVHVMLCITCMSSWWKFLWNFLKKKLSVIWRLCILIFNKLENIACTCSLCIKCLTVTSKIFPSVLITIFWFYSNFWSFWFLF